MYTSSSSVYGSIGGKIDFSDKNNRLIYSSLKIAAENLFKNFCTKNKINFDICRVFNIYGPNDNFSIVSKLVELKNSNKKFKFSITETLFEILFMWKTWFQSIKNY